MSDKLSPYTPGVPIKIRERDRRGYLRETGGYTGWTEWQCVQGRRVISRHDLRGHAEKAKAQFEAGVRK